MKQGSIFYGGIVLWNVMQKYIILMNDRVVNIMNFLIIGGVMIVQRRLVICFVICVLKLLVVILGICRFFYIGVIFSFVLWQLNVFLELYIFVIMKYCMVDLIILVRKVSGNSVVSYFWLMFVVIWVLSYVELRMLRLMRVMMFLVINLFVILVVIVVVLLMIVRCYGRFFIVILYC